MTWAAEHKFWLGEWSCPECDAQSEPFEDHSVCEACATSNRPTRA